MRFKAEKKKDRDRRLAAWHPYFAWFPVRWDGGWAWLETVQRRKMMGVGYREFWLYKPVDDEDGE